MDTSEWSQKGICLIKTNQTQPQTHSSEMMMRRVTKPQKDHSINCPRCDSTNTKFCYYNNYSLSQPRYFCKTCRRYWTAGGTLRNVPVGGGSRKNKRPSPSSSTPKPSIISPPSSTSSTNQPSQDLINLAYKLYHGRDLNLSFPDRTLTEPGRFGPDPGSMFGDGFGPVSAMKMHPLFGAGVDGVDHGRLLFPFEDLKHVSMMNGSSENKDVVQGHNGDSTFFWNGVMGNGGAGGSW